MAQSTMGSKRMIGDYLVGRQIGSGSFSVVWYAKHSVLGNEVAIKEIATGSLNKKLQDNLMSEIFILKKVSHPNIILLHDIIEKPGKIHLVLEYCKGGDLSMYINRHGKVPEATAKHFMQQLAAGLQVLRDNNMIHRDLKPQNLLLSANDSKAVLKIADFGFARSLQPKGLAETLCGSPLYMAPEIMQLQKYDAKADLWSVGAILFQLVTGRTPFNGNNQMQLLQNILRSTDLYFPPNSNNLSSECKDLCRKLLCRNPVERLTFEEFFNHPFLSARHPENSSRLINPARVLKDFPLSDSRYTRDTEDVTREEFMPFPLDDNSSGPDGSPSSLRKPVVGFPVPTNHNRGHVATKVAHNNLDTCTDEVKYTNEHTKSHTEEQKPVSGNLKETMKSRDFNSSSFHSKVGDSMELSDYVLVSGPPLDGSSLASSFKLDHPLSKSENVLLSLTSPMPIVGTTTSRLSRMQSLEDRNSAPGNSQGSMDCIDSLERPSTHGPARIKSLQKCAATINELVNEKVTSGKQLEAFSTQLVILAIWKQALHICHTHAASAMEGSPDQHSAKQKHSVDVSNDEEREAISSEIEREFLTEVERAEELAQVIEAGSIEMPDAIEIIFQSALSLGRSGAVDELMGDVENASLLYSKAVQLLLFILVEAPSLILNPPLSLTISDRYRLRTYIDILRNRLGHSIS